MQVELAFTSGHHSFGDEGNDRDEGVAFCHYLVYTKR